MRCGHQFIVKFSHNCASERCPRALYELQCLCDSMKAGFFYRPNDPRPLTARLFQCYMPVVRVLYMEEGDASLALVIDNVKCFDVLVDCWIQCCYDRDRVTGTIWTNGAPSLIERFFILLSCVKYRLCVCDRVRFCVVLLLLREVRYRGGDLFSCFYMRFMDFVCENIECVALSNVSWQRIQEFRI